MQSDDQNNLNVNSIQVYSGDPANGSPEQHAELAAKQKAIQARLPKFRLEEGEEFHISESELMAINEDYFQMLDSMKEGFNITGQEMRSYMESVIFASYRSKIEKIQREAEEKSYRDRYVHTLTSEKLEPGYEHRRFRRKRPNYPLQLCMEESEIEALIELAKISDDIARQKEFVYGGSDRAEEVTDLILSSIPRYRRKRFKKKNEDLLRQISALVGVRNAAFMPDVDNGEAEPERQETSEHEIPHLDVPEDINFQEAINYEPEGEDAFDYNLSGLEDELNEQNEAEEEADPDDGAEEPPEPEQQEIELSGEDEPPEDKEDPDDIGEGGDEG